MPRAELARHSYDHLAHRQKDRIFGCPLRSPRANWDLGPTTPQDWLDGIGIYGFVGVTVSGDRASENRSAFGALASVTAASILNKFWNVQELKEVDASMKVGFPHPHPLLKDDIVVLVGGEMPHWVKKFRNAFENKTRGLVFRGQPMDLETLYVIWKTSGDMDVDGGSKLRRYKFTHDHFDLNAFTKMRVFLAVQFASQTMIRMIRDYCDGRPGELPKFEPLLELLNAVDRLVDIMNGINKSKGEFRNVEPIDSPTHRHVRELLNILKLFVEWKGQCKGKGVR